MNKGLSQRQPESKNAFGDVIAGYFGLSTEDDLVRSVAPLASTSPHSFEEKTFRSEERPQCQDADMPSSPSGNCVAFEEAVTIKHGRLDTSPFDKWSQSAALAESYPPNDAVFEEDPMEIDLITDAYRTIRVLVQTHFDHLFTPGEIVRTYKDTMTKEVIDTMPFPVRVRFRNYLVMKGVYSPPIDVNAALYSLLNTNELEKSGASSVQSSESGQGISPTRSVAIFPLDVFERRSALEAARSRMKYSIREYRPCSVDQVDVFSIPSGTDVLIYRDKSNIWEGPYTLYTYDGYKTAYVNIKGNIKPFSILSVQPFQRYSEEIRTKRIASEVATSEIASPDACSIHSLPASNTNATKYFPSHGRSLSGFKSSNTGGYHSRLNVHILVLNYTADPRFTDVESAEMKCKLDGGAYVIFDEDSIPPGATVFGALFERSIKPDKDGKPVHESYLSIQGFIYPQSADACFQALGACSALFE